MGRGRAGSLCLPQQLQTPGALALLLEGGNIEQVGCPCCAVGAHVRLKASCCPCSEYCQFGARPCALDFQVIAHDHVHA